MTENLNILDQFGRPVKKKAKPEKRILGAAPIYDGYREYVANGLTPQKLAGIFKEADTGNIRRQCELFEQFQEKDGHLIGERGKRVNVISDVDFELLPASEDKRDQEIAEFVREYFDSIELPDILVDMQDAVGKGFSALEVKWDASEGQALPVDLEFIPQRRFVFFDKGGRLLNYPLLVTDENVMGEDIPEWKILYHRYGGRSGHPTRSGIMRVCAWMYLFKNYSIKDWVVFAETYGMPLRLGKYAQSANDGDKEALYRAIKSIGTDAAGIISESTAIEFIESSKGKAHADIFEALVTFCNREISKALLGQTLSAEVGDTGSYAAAQTHNEVRLDLVKADARACASTIRNQLIRPIIGFNFGWDTPVPRYQAIVAEPEDLKEKSDYLCALMDRGVVMGMKYIRDQFSIPEPEEGEEIVGGKPASVELTEKETAKQRLQKNTVVGKAEADEPDGPDLLAERLEKDAGTHMDDMIEPVLRLVMKSKSLEEIREGLIDLFPDMDSVALGNTMQLAFTASEMAGRFDSIVEAGEGENGDG